MTLGCGRFRPNHLGIHAYARAAARMRGAAVETVPRVQANAATRWRTYGTDSRSKPGPNLNMGHDGVSRQGQERGSR